jgi:hypothetical protein
LQGAAAGLVLTMFVDRRVRAADGPTLLIVTGRGTAITSIAKAELRRLFLGDRVTAGGQQLTAFNLPAASAERQLFEQRVLEMSPVQVAKYWIDRRIRGQSGAPKTAPGPEVLLKIAANFPGAITYVPSVALGPAVKALAIDGRSSTSPGYLLAG